MNVLFIIGSMGRGGAERTIAGLCAGLTDRGHEVAVATFAGTDQDAYDLPPDAHRIVMGHWGTSGGGVSRLTALLRRVAAIRRAIRRTGCDTVVGFQTQEAIMTILAARSLRRRPRIVVSERSSYWMRRRDPLWVRLFERVYRYSDAQVAQTRRVADRLAQDTGSRNVRVIPNAVRTDLTGIGPRVRPEDTLAEDQKVILLVGSKPRVKGFDIALEAFKTFLEGRPDDDWRLVILGLPVDHAFNRTIAEAPVAAHVLTTGPVSNMADWYSRADIVILPSRHEGMPNALMEAMALGRPVIAADCETGPAELIEDGVTGLLVPVEDARALAQALSKLADDPSRASRLARAATSIAEDHRPERIYLMWEETLSGRKAA